MHTEVRSEVRTEVCSEMRSEVCAKVRRKIRHQQAQDRRKHSPSGVPVASARTDMDSEVAPLPSTYFTEAQRDRMRSAAQALLECYAALSEHGTHLLGEILDDSPPRQWAHYPDDDVIDRAAGYQFFYHSHSPDDRDSATEHGHFHLFARQDVHGPGIDPHAETNFLQSQIGEQPAYTDTIHLLCVSLNAKGVPKALFTVNRWVTGGHLLSATTTLRLIAGFTIQAMNCPRVSKWLTALLALFRPQIEKLLMERDKTLLGLASGRREAGLFDDESIELLSSVTIDIDQQIGWLFNEER